MNSKMVYKIISNSISVGILFLTGIFTINFVVDGYEIRQSWRFDFPIIPILITLSMGIIFNKIIRLFIKQNKGITLSIENVDMLNDYDCITIQGQAGSGKSYLADLIIKQNPIFSIIDEGDDINNFSENIRQNLSLRKKIIVTVTEYKRFPGLWESIIEMIKARKLKLAQIRVSKWGEFELYEN